MIRSEIHALACAALTCLVLLVPSTGWPQEDAGSSAPTASFTIDARLGGRSPERVRVALACRAKTGEQLLSEQAALGDGETTEFLLELPSAGAVECAITAEQGAGLRVSFAGDGGSEVDVSRSGCRFSGVAPGHANFCQVRLEAQVTSVTVYKKWIGADREVDDVVAHLRCVGLAAQESRQVNAGRPGAWTLDVTDPEGVLCEVVEEEREDYVPDMNDCQGLLVLPGTEEECTLVNTKVVKMIDMLNRYGLAIMIAVFAVAGMLAARKFVP